ncbi:hypothetical protein DVH24_027643 [Malus domestica]|uniref:Uncharacterized protein n=1 Tax=Malus domestica TaxID=3750 RepID=A0A498H810_MALDO|nr:hypothetical protein DVH24_027643 [Malus domestica]
MYVRPPKLVPHCPMVPSSSSYFTINSFSHSSVVAAKMVAIYVVKRKRVSLHDDLPLPFYPVSKAKHVKFTYFDDEDEDNNVANEDVIAKTDASSSSMRLDVLSHSEEL